MEDMEKFMEMEEKKDEAGLGTTAAIHAESGCRTPCEQGLMNIFELIVDTFVICSLTAVGILSSGVELLGGADGAQLVTTAFGRVYGGLAGKLAAVSIAGFGIATVIGWSRIGLAAADLIYAADAAVTGNDNLRFELVNDNSI